MTDYSSFFPSKGAQKPIIYAYDFPDVPSHNGYIKVGYTTRTAAERIKEQTHTAGFKANMLMQWSAVRDDGAVFTDKDVHKVLERRGHRQLHGTSDGNEWYECTLDDVKSAVICVATGKDTGERRSENFTMRPEQQAAVEKAASYYKKEAEARPGRAAKFLWNAKMRFGKTFAAYQLARVLGMKKVLVLTFKPAVETAWRSDLETHVDFARWQFIARGEGLPSIDEQYANADKAQPIVCFGSFQDFLGVDKETGGIKAHNEWVHTTNWDMVVFDEYHFDAWKDRARALFEMDEDEYDEGADSENYVRGNDYDEGFLPITATRYLYLSGTPFRALNSGEFIEDQVYSWTYSDEQRAKEMWAAEHGGDNSGNPYSSMPQMVMMTYRIPDEVSRIARAGEFDEFDLNVFFSAVGKGQDAVFKYAEYVQKWLDLMRGAYMKGEDLKMGRDKPPMPYSDVRLLQNMNHTLWFLPNVAACHAMAALLAQKQNMFYHDFTVNVCAGVQAGLGAQALRPVRESMHDPLNSRTITISCGKLTTGVTVRPWTAIFMLRNLKTPETYFQAAFRVQSPWTVKNDDGRTVILKKVCYVFDFALDRALHEICDYAAGLDTKESNPERKVGEFIKFLPVLAYDGSAMRQVDAAEILQMALSGTSATLLAKRWDSAMLVNVDNDTLQRLMENQEAMDALMRIEDFRNLNDEIAIIIAKSEEVKKAKTRETVQTEERIKPTGETNKDEQDYKKRRLEIQKKLRKLATRLPVFMYLSDYREYSLVDVIRNIEGALFQKATGLSVEEFNLLLDLGVFNRALMNDAVYKFKRYEDASLEYTGLDMHKGESAGGFDVSGGGIAIGRQQAAGSRKVRYNGKSMEV